MFRTSEDYEDFASYIRRESRYVLDARQNEFLETIVETSRKRVTTPQEFRAVVLCFQWNEARIMPSAASAEAMTSNSK